MPELWTDGELDRALADQPAGPEFGAAARARAVARMDEAFAEPSSRRHRWVAAAAVVTLVVGGMFAVRALDHPPAAGAAASLEQAAEGARKSPDDPLAAGEYHYLARHSWDLASGRTRAGAPLGVLVHEVRRTWIPGDRSAEWLERSSTVDWKWVLGSQEQAETEGDDGLLGALHRTTGERKGPCGDFPGDNGELGGTPDDGTPCAERQGSWHDPAPPFLAALPLDPDALYSQLDSAAHGNAAEALSLSAGVLSAPDASPALRAALYRALIRLPTLEITENAADLDGRTGVALGVLDNPAAPRLRFDIVVDPTTGRFIGNRTVLAGPGVDRYAGLPAGTAIEFSSFVTATVRAVGVEP
ncbi:CU044_5270 family protein [Actinosynnema sp. NPDC020468]|uniref:CU044_5270 family protein n=1 Tax=Actinosynnema sp. NPDC020468 TaxID=3154488 RepID=UPI0033CC77C0